MPEGAKSPHEDHIKIRLLGSIVCIQARLYIGFILRLVKLYFKQFYFFSLDKKL